MTGKIIYWSWSIFPRFMMIIILVLGIKLMIHATDYVYPFELIVWGFIAMVMMLLLSFFSVMQDVLNGKSYYD